MGSDLEAVKQWRSQIAAGKLLGVRAVFGGRRPVPIPLDRAKLGSKRHLICDGGGVPLAIQLTGANRNDSRQTLSLIDAIPQLQGVRGRLPSSA